MKRKRFSWITFPLTVNINRITYAPNNLALFLEIALEKTFGAEA